MSLGFGKGTANVSSGEKKSLSNSQEREEDEQTDGPLLESHGTRATAASNRENRAEPAMEEEEEEHELRIAEEEDEEADDVEARHDKRRVREPTGDNNELAHGEKIDSDPRRHHRHQPASVVRV
jgi:hypothetical protein